MPTNYLQHRISISSCKYNIGLDKKIKYRIGTNKISNVLKTLFIIYLSAFLLCLFQVNGDEGNIEYREDRE